MTTDQGRSRRKGGDFPFARKMERKAWQIAKPFNDKINGVKPWYSYAELFEGQAIRIFVGLNPGGTSESEKLDNQHKKRVYGEPNYCAWLDEEWEKSSSLTTSDDDSHQGRARRAFQAMYDCDEWEQVFRETPCFNVIPLRTSSAGKLPSGSWEAAQPWFRQVIKYLRPRLIICNGSAEKESAWAAINEIPSITIKSEKPILTANNGYIKYGRVTSKKLRGVKVVALPHLSKRFFWPEESQFQKLKALRDSRPDLFI